MSKLANTEGMFRPNMSQSETKLARTDAIVRQMDATEKAAVDAKTARLRALRLAKEAAEAENPEPKPKKPARKSPKK